MQDINHSTEELPAGDIFYSRSRKTVNTRENFWNVYCFATNQMRDETAKDNRQTAAGISHDLQDLIRNNQLVHSSTRNLQFSLCITLKSHFLPQTNSSHLIPSVKKPNYRIDRTNCENLQRYRFASWAKVSQLPKTRIENHQSQPSSMIFWTARETNTEEHCLWLAHFSRAQTSCLAVSDRPDPLFRKISFIYIPPKPKSRKRNFNISDRKNWRFLVEENTSSLFRVKTWLINAAVWRLSFAVSSHIWLVAKQ